MFPVITAVKHIADNNHCPGFKGLQQSNKPLNVFFKNSLWHSDTGFPEMPGFAEMKIRKNKRFLFLPVNDPVGG